MWDLFVNVVIVLLLLVLTALSVAFIATVVLLLKEMFDERR